MGTGSRKRMVGHVSSTKMDKTVVVKVDRSVLHKLYGKAQRRTKKIVAHDGKSLCAVGDKVVVEETRPLSRTKRWRVVEIVQKTVESAVS